MLFTVNGKQRQFDADGADGHDVELMSVLRAFEINPKLVAVGINGEVIPRHQYISTRVRDGDVLEIVRMVGGGAA